MADVSDIGVTFRSTMNLAAMQLTSAASYGASAITAAAGNSANSIGFEHTALNDIARLREFLDTAEAALRSLSDRKAA